MTMEQSKDLTRQSEASPEEQLRNPARNTYSLLPGVVCGLQEQAGVNVEMEVLELCDFQLHQLQDPGQVTSPF